MDDKGTGGSGDAFPGELRALAQEIQALAVKKRADEVNSDRGYQNGLRSGQAGPPSGEQPLIRAGDAEYQALEKSYEWIPDAFERFTRPDPDDFQPMIDLFDPVIRTFGPDADAVDAGSRGRATGDTVMSHATSLGYVTTWMGGAARSYKDFVDPFDLITRNQCAIAHVLRDGMTANKTIFGSSRKDVRNIAEKTKTALTALDDFGGDDAQVLLSVAAAVGGVLATVATGGGALPLVFSGGAAVAGVGSAIAGAKKMPIAGHTVDGTLGNMLSALTETSGQIYESERTIAKWLDLNLDGITDPKNRSLIIAPRPRLAGADSANIKDHLKPPY